MVVQGLRNPVPPIFFVLLLSSATSWAFPPTHPLRDLELPHSLAPISSDVFRVRGEYPRCQAHTNGKYLTVETVGKRVYKAKAENWTYKLYSTPHREAAADHILELQIISGTMNIFGYTLDQWDKGDINQIVDIANSKLNMQNIPSYINNYKKTAVAAFLADIIKDVQHRQCVPFDKKSNVDLDKYLIARAYLLKRCYAFITTAQHIEPIISNPRRNPEGLLTPDIMHITYQILDCFGIKVYEKDCNSQSEIF